MWLREDEGGRAVEFEGFADSTDLAITGVFMEASYLLPIGYPINLEMLIHTGETVSARGEIVHRLDAGEHPGRDSGMGIRFEEIDSVNRERLLRYFVTDQIQDFFHNRFIVEFPHLEEKTTLDEIALIVNLWGDKSDRMSRMRHPGDADSKRARVAEASARSGAAAPAKRTKARA